MKIGILTYHAVYNFGANLQALSTFSYLRNAGHDPIIIDFFPQELEVAFNKSVPVIQANSHKSFIKKTFKLTERCRNAVEIANAIRQNEIEAIIIGSDAVVQHHPLLSRLRIYPSRKKIIKVRIDPVQYETNFPNPFWGEFLNYLKKDIPTVMMSVSSQNTSYSLILGKKKKNIYEAIKKIKYISVRDKWTQELFKRISNGRCIPKITPDPVFAFNNNYLNIPTKEDLIKKYHIPDKYILLSFGTSKTVSKSWLSSFEQIAAENGFNCVAFGMPEGIKFAHNLRFKIDIPIDPIDWYALIKYSSAYVGEKMHPIIVSLHNSVPCFSFDHYGILRFFFHLNKKSSKIFDILSNAGLKENRISILKKLNYTAPSPQLVFNKLMNFNKSICGKFAKRMLDAYDLMMKEILCVLENN